MTFRFDVTLRHEYAGPTLQRIERLCEQIERKIDELLRRSAGGMTAEEAAKVAADATAAADRLAGIRGDRPPA